MTPHTEIQHPGSNVFHERNFFISRCHLHFDGVLFRFCRSANRVGLFLTIKAGTFLDPFRNQFNLILFQSRCILRHPLIIGCDQFECHQTGSRISRYQQQATPPPFPHVGKCTQIQIRARPLCAVAVGTLLIENRCNLRFKTDSFIGTRSTTSPSHGFFEYCPTCINQSFGTDDDSIRFRNHRICSQFVEFGLLFIGQCFCFIIFFLTNQRCHFTQVPFDRSQFFTLFRCQLCRLTGSSEYSGEQNQSQEESSNLNGPMRHNFPLSFEIG